MEESRGRALERLLRELDSFDLTAPPYETETQLFDDVTSVLLPFLQNPERHGRHVGIVLEYTVLAGTARAMRPMLQIYRLPLFRRLVERRFANYLESLRKKIQSARDEVLAAVDPGEIKVDLLPIASVATKPDWRRQGRRLILIETRGALAPATGMQLRAISHQIQVTSPAGCQFVDAIPSNEMEVIGQREVSISDRGKFVFSATQEDKLAASLSGGAAKVQSSLGHKESSGLEAEVSTAEKRSDSPQVVRVISSAVGDTATWQLLRTPSQTLLGSSKFSATALIPSDTARLTLVVRFGADIEGWGPTSVQNSHDVPIPPFKS